MDVKKLSTYNFTIRIKKRFFLQCCLKFISKNTTIGLASKDYAKVFSNDVDMNDVEICISAYSKKQEFNGGLVDIKTMKCKNYYKETDIDASSKITIGKTFYENKKQI